MRMATQAESPVLSSRPNRLLPFPLHPIQLHYSIPNGRTCHESRNPMLELLGQVG